MKPFGIISDTHHHPWSAFSETLPNGVNSRLQILLDETKRCAAEVRKAGGDTIVHGGDLFHVRGSIAPTVLNPTKDCYRDLIKDGFKIIINAGNHDLEGKEAERVSSAITSLEDIGCKVINTLEQGIKGDGGRIAFVPWMPKIDQLKTQIEKVRDSDPKPGEIDLILHAPIDGVILGVPDHGLDAAYLASLGFKRVFSGHYHNFKDFGNGVYSIGALAHHTWSDIGSKAGFLIVSDEGVKWHKSHAPEFVEIDGSTDPDDIPLIVDGQFVRAKLNTSKQSDIENSRQFLLDSGAKGVVVIAEKSVAVSKRDGGATIKAGASMETSVSDFIKAQSFTNPEALALLCDEILNEARGA
jgi:DNA repair exonuclease SbcCD nuclease subunit